MSNILFRLFTHSKVFFFKIKQNREEYACWIYLSLLPPTPCLVEEALNFELKPLFCDVNKLTTKHIFLFPACFLFLPAQCLWLRRLRACAWWERERLLTRFFNRRYKMARLQEIVQSFSGLFWRKDKRGRKNLKCSRKKQMNGGESYTQKNRHRLLQIMDPQQVQN